MREPAEDFRMGGREGWKSQEERDWEEPEDRSRGRGHGSLAGFCGD